MLLWIVRVIDNQRAAQPITVLVLVVTVIPICSLGYRGSELDSIFQYERQITVWFKALNLYKKLSLGTIGHWVTKAAPST